jgi:hypothetical protein
MTKTRMRRRDAFRWNVTAAAARRRRNAARRPAGSYDVPWPRHEFERGAKPGGQCAGVVALHWKPTAPLRPIEVESREDDGGARPCGRRQGGDVGVLLRPLAEEMEHGAVVPDVPCPGRRPVRDVGDEPGDPAGIFPQSRLRALQRRCGDVQLATSAKPRARRSSTSVAAPPPTSITEALCIEAPGAADAWSIYASDRTECG